jgi:hypothetical protein
MDIAETGAPSVEPYKDRSAGLVIFGILTILAGCLAGLLVLLMVAGQRMVAHNGGMVRTVVQPAWMMVYNVIFYGVAVVALVWLGIGSIMARRWARALLLIFSWCALVMGVFMTGVLALVMPRMMANVASSGPAGQHPLPPGAMQGAMCVSVAIIAFLFILIPLVGVIFYGSGNVKATCEARDPVRRWTDACPLPVLAVSIWATCSAPLFLIMICTGYKVMPFFGLLLTGIP